MIYADSCHSSQPLVTFTFPTRLQVLVILYHILLIALNFLWHIIAFLAAVDSGIEPRHFREAITSSLWHEAMTKECDALNKNGTWELVDAPIDKNVIGNKWVYKIKYKAYGTVE